MVKYGKKLQTLQTSKFPPVLC